VKLLVSVQPAGTLNGYRARQLCSVRGAHRREGLTDRSARAHSRARALPSSTFRLGASSCRCQKNRPVVPARSGSLRATAACRFPRPVSRRRHRPSWWRSSRGHTLTSTPSCRHRSPCLAREYDQCDLGLRLRRGVTGLIRRPTLPLECTPGTDVHHAPAPGCPPFARARPTGSADIAVGRPLRRRLEGKVDLQPALAGAMHVHDCGHARHAMNGVAPSPARDGSHPR
jgi:hypothetical protein